MSDKYRKFGLRRDKNLSDIPDKNAALTNLLEGLSTSENGFLPDDIFVINGLNNSDVVNEDLRQLDGLLRKYSPVAGGSAENLEPLVRVQDNIENFRSELGTPPYILGGDGLKTYFIPSSQLAAGPFTNTTSGSDIYTGTTESDGSPTVTGGIVGPEFFWNTGAFDFGTKIYDTFDDDYGAIQWIGYASTLISLTFKSQGLLIVEQDFLDVGNWEIVKSVYGYDRTIQVLSAVYDGTTSTTIGVGDDIKHVVINDLVDNQFPVTAINYDTQEVVVSGNASGIGSSNTFSYSVSSGNVYDTGFFDISEVSLFDKLKTRITIIYPTSVNYGDKTLSAGATGRLGLTNSDYLPYNYFYTESTENQTPGIYDLKYFYDNRIDEKNQIISDSHIQTSDSFIVNYSPDTTFTNNLKYTGNVRLMNSLRRGKFVSAGQFGEVEVGDWLAFSALTAFGTKHFAVQVKEKPNSSLVFCDAPQFLANESNIEFVVFKNLGLVGLYKYVSGVPGTSLVIEDLVGDSPEYTEAKVDNFLGLVELGSPIVANASPYRITDFQDLTGTANVAISDFTGTSGTVTTPDFVAVYSHTGLQELSSEAACAGVYGLEVTTLVPNNADTILVTSTSDVANNDYIQYGTSISQGTTVTVANSTALTLSANTVGEIPVGGTIVLMSSDPGATNKEFCVLPLNTAPPFEGTNTGLKTTASFPDLSTQKLTFRDIEIKGATVNSLTTQTQYTERLSIRIKGKSYRLLIE